MLSRPVVCRRTPCVTPVSLLLLLALTAFALLLAAAGCEKPPAAVAPPPPEVLVTSVVRENVPVQRDLVGQTAGFQDVEIRARVEGYLLTVNFIEGTFVHAGDLLYEIDPKAFEAAAAQARANLAQADARQSKAQQDVTRFTPLAKMQAISQQELDTAVSALDAARAQVDAMRAVLDRAELDLGYTHISAPIDGLIDVTRVKPGNLVGRGESTLLTTISQIDPILVRCSVTEAEYLDYVRKHGPQDGRSDTAKGPAADLTLSDGSVHAYKGKVYTVERSVDASTGALNLQFSFPNPDDLLRPGQFARVTVVTETLDGALLVPQRSVQELQGQFSVAVVGSDGIVALRTVKTGPRIGSRWVITEGLQAGENVVVEGLQRARDGVKVTPKTAPAPEASDTPAGDR